MYETVGEGERGTCRERVCKSVGEREIESERMYFKKGCHLIFVYVLFRLREHDIEQDSAQA
jgi:hypothetical protein